jgi:hypothetical protein
VEVIVRDGRGEHIILDSWPWWGDDSTWTEGSFREQREKTYSQVLRMVNKFRRDGQRAFRLVLSNVEHGHCFAHAGWRIHGFSVWGLTTSGGFQVGYIYK